MDRSEIWHTRVIFAALCAMLTVPFLNAHHFQPIPSFYQEWSAAACGLIAATWLLGKKRIEALELPAIALLPLGLVGLVLLQMALGFVVFAGQALLFMLYLLWALLIVTLGRSLRKLIGLDRVATLCAAALLFGALLAVALLVLQLTGFGATRGWVFGGTRGSGNLAQANHLASYLWLGLCSAVYLRVSDRIGRVIFIVAALLLLAAASLTGSRSTLVYAFGLAAFSLWCAWYFKPAALRRIARLTAGLLLVMLIMHFVFNHFDVANRFHAPLAGERLWRETSGPSVRLQLWRTGLAIFSEHRWLGAGVGQFPAEAYRLIGAQPGADLRIAEHAHNLLVDLLCEFGPLAPLLVILLGLRWWLAFVRQDWSVSHWWIAAILLVLSTHSQLEYPLWYAFFLGIAALALGLGSTSGFAPRIRASGRLLLGAIIVLGSASLLSLESDYRRLERALNAGSARAPAIDKTLALLGSVHRGSLLASYVEMIYAVHMPVDREVLKDKITVTERAIRLAPVDRITFKLAYLLALDGQNDAARAALRHAAAGHPAYLPTASEQLTFLLREYPQLDYLRDELRRITEERQRETNAASARPAPPARR